MASPITEVFTEKFRPKDLNQIILVPRIRDEVNKGLIQNILFYGSPGTGKTSLAYIMSKGYTTLYINASLERGIETVRERITKFCSSISLEGGKEKLKCVIFDETDGGTTEFFMALRPVLERYVKVCRFIATCNYIQKIPEPIQSRFNCISLDPINNEEEILVKDAYKKRIGQILTAAKISYNDTILDKFITNDFPDMRALLNKVQSFYLQGIKELNDKNFNINFSYQDLFMICLNKPDKPWDIYKQIISEYSTKVDETLVALGSDFPEFIKTNSPNKLDKLPQVLICVAEFQYQKAFVIDPVITLCAAIFKLQIILNS